MVKTEPDVKRKVKTKPDVKQKTEPDIKSNKEHKQDVKPNIESNKECKQEQFFSFFRNFRLENFLNISSLLRFEKCTSEN